RRRRRPRRARGRRQRRLRRARRPPRRPRARPRAAKGVRIMSTQAPALLPPGVSSDDFAAALDELASACGAEALLTSEEDIAGFRDPFQFATWEEYAASAVVLPDTVEQIQQVVGIANRYRIPLWTHGQGKNNGYGGPAPRVDGSLIVSLRNMNRVLEIDEDCAY